MYASHLSSVHLSCSDLNMQDMAGFSRSRYKPAGPSAASVVIDEDAQHDCMFSTQFAPCEARRAFPCFDEPAIKASFKFSIEIPDDMVALSNMPVRETTTSSRLGNSNVQGWKVVHFEKSPAMSTYLYTWAFGDFAYVEAETQRSYNGKPLPVRVYATKGSEEQGRYALDHAWKIIDVLSEVSTSSLSVQSIDINQCFRCSKSYVLPDLHPWTSFDKRHQDYPLPKIDLLAVHDFVSPFCGVSGCVQYTPVLTV